MALNYLLIGLRLELMKHTLLIALHALLIF